MPPCMAATAKGSTRGYRLGFIFGYAVVLLVCLVASFVAFIGLQGGVAWCLRWYSPSSATHSKSTSANRRSRDGTTKSSAAAAPSQDKTSFDYDGFWRGIRGRVAQYLAAHSSVSPGTNKTGYPKQRPPRVFLYELPEPLADLEVASYSRDQIFGKVLHRIGDGCLADGPFGMSAGYALAAMVHYRIHTSKLYRTMNPDEADLFLVPILTKPKRQKRVADACTRLAALGAAEIERLLPHLTPATASRHVLLFSKEHFQSGELNCTGWFANPGPLLSRAIRLAYSSVQTSEMHVWDYNPSSPLGDVTDGLWAFYDDKGDEIAHAMRLRAAKLSGPLASASKLHLSTYFSYPNLHAVPFPSSVHMRCGVSRNGLQTTSKPIPEAAEDLPWDTYAARTHRMLFIGDPNHGDTGVRHKIVSDCRHMPNQTCLVQGYAVGRSLMSKRGADFCLEPAGDTPFRKSFTDSVSLGCIPVLFHPMSDQASDWLWDDWKEAGRVLVPRDAYLRGEVSLDTLLIDSMPPDLLRQMKQVLSHNARRMTISYEDDPGDGLHNILTEAAWLATSQGPASVRRSNPSRAGHPRDHGRAPRGI